MLPRRLAGLGKTGTAFVAASGPFPSPSRTDGAMLAPSETNEPCDQMAACQALRPVAKALVLRPPNVWVAAWRLTAVSRLLRTGHGGPTAKAGLCPTAPRARSGGSVIA